MYFKSSLRNNPATNSLCAYFRLVESYRNEENRICHKTMLNIGFLPDDLENNPEYGKTLNAIQKILTDKAQGKESIFEEKPLVEHYVALFWEQMIHKGTLDLTEKNAEKRKKLVDIESIKHKNVREIGTEWLCMQAFNQLGISEFLIKRGWSQEKAQLACTQIIARAIYPFSELKTNRIIQENSAICELTSYPLEKMTKDKLYKSALDLYEIKDQMEGFLSKKTNELFDLEDKIILFDLTNTYFEGSKRDSKLAKFGRSKEKRNDAKLVVLALVVNLEGFIKYSHIFEGNTSDSASLPLIIDQLRARTSLEKRATVVLDAGIATEDNLKLLDKKGYDYVCVSRTKLKDYKIEDTNIVKVVTNNKEVISLQKVSSDKNTDYYLRVQSPGKRLKELGMKTRFEERFEEELNKIKVGLTKKGGLKNFEKVHQKIGRITEKYPSAAQQYSTKVTENKGIALTITWEKKTEKEQDATDNLGVYFVRTNLKTNSEKLLWEVYNSIREIESSFRCLKTDLDLRPIYHKNDDATMAHLNLGLLAYSLVNTIRFQLKNNKINHDWQEIVRIGNTQKMITTEGKNVNGQLICMRKSSEPEEKLTQIYQVLGYKQVPFRKRKFVVHKSTLKKNENAEIQVFTG